MDAITKFRKMIQFETISYPDDRDIDKFLGFHGLLKELFPLVWSKTEVREYDGSLLLRYRGKSQDGPVLFMHHHDVVPVSGNWTHEPFSADIADGQIWGRGTIDTKSGLWAMLEAAEELLEEGFVPDKDIYFVSTRNEETSGLGAKLISEALKKENIHFSLVLDEGNGIFDDPDNPGGKAAFVALGEKACSELRFTARGRGGHASLPPKNSPAVKLARFIAAAEDNADTIFPPELNTLTNEMQQTTMAFTMLSASNGSNVMPTEASAVVSMRCAHHQGTENSIKAASDFAASMGIETEIIKKGFDTGISSTDTYGFRLIEKGINKIYPGVRIKCMILAALTDSKYMTSISDCTIRFRPIAIKPDQRKGVHGIDERVDAAALPPAVEYFKYCIRSCGQ